VSVLTPPNYAGPASIEVTNQWGITDNVTGALVYVDDLRLSFINPSIARVDQRGPNDKAEITGYGFNPGIRVTAYPEGKPELAVINRVDNDRLILKSGEKLFWALPDFGDSYRGFITVEISSDSTEKVILPQAVFYGGLIVDKSISIGTGEISPGFFPKGQIVALDADEDKGLIYVLATGPKQKINATSYDALKEKKEPGWISLVHYERDALENAAPMHGLGYYNLPPELSPSSIKKVNDTVYVTARAESYVGFDTEYAAGEWLLIFDAIEALPGSGDGSEQAEGDNRYIRHSLLIPSATQSVADKHFIDYYDNLLIAASKGGAVNVYSIINPLRPTLLRSIKQVSGARGAVPLRTQAVYVDDGKLFVNSGNWVVFDLQKASVPELTQFEASQVMTPSLQKDRHVANNLSLHELTAATQWKKTSELESFGFQVPGEAVLIDTHGTLATVINRDKCVGGLYKGYLSLIDYSDLETPYLVDGMPYSTNYKPTEKEQIGLDLFGQSGENCTGASAADHIFTKDGISVLAYGALHLVDTHIQELTASWPQDGQKFVPLDSSITLDWTLPIENLNDVKGYISLIKVMGADSADVIASAVSINPENSRQIIITPQNPLVADSKYQIQLTGVKASRRTQGLVDLALNFSTGNYTGENITWDNAEKNYVSVNGETIWLTLSHANNPEFFFSGKQGQVLAIEEVSITQSRYQVALPSGIAGSIFVEVKDDDARYWASAGELIYTEPMVLQGISPAEGTLEGTQQVVITATGFAPDVADIKVFFGNQSADTKHYQLLDTTQLQLLTPPGILGSVDVRVELTDGQSDTLVNAYLYQQPIQSEIGTRSKSAITAMSIDPSATYMMVGVGSELNIFNIDPSKWTADNTGTDANGKEILRDPLNPDDLRRKIDLDGDGADDRLVFSWHLPDGFVLLGVQGYFERGHDLIYMAAAKPDESSEFGFREAKLFILGVSDDFSTAQLIRSLELPGNMARGILVENNQALISLGTAGLGLVDTYIPSKTYLMESANVKGDLPALGLARTNQQLNDEPVYAVVSGHWTYPEQKLISNEVAGLGGFTLMSRSTNGMQAISGLDIPASDIEVKDQFAFLAAGDRGVIVLDISDVQSPKVVSRNADLGHVHDLSISGHVLYAAIGGQGIISLDISNPEQLELLTGLDAFNDANIMHVTALSASVVGGGHKSEGVLQVYPDSNLKLFTVDPANGILDFDGDDRLTAIFRFSKAIDNHDSNLNKFSVLNSLQQPVEFELNLNGNQAEIYIKPNQNLSVGDVLHYYVYTGLASVKRLTEDNSLTLYELKYDQHIELTYRGQYSTKLSIDSLLPRRQLLGEPLEITASALGVPLDISRVKLSIGGQEAQIDRIESNDEVERAGVIFATHPGLNVAGYYDVTLEVERYGLWESTKLFGALAIDKAIKLNSVTPQWGPLVGGTRIEVLGEGFEPGNTVMDGLVLTIGSAPVTNIDVISSSRLIAHTPRGNTGRQKVIAQNRYGSKDELPSKNGFGFGYGLRSMGSAKAALVKPLDVWVDQETGVAITTAGYFQETFPHDESGLHHKQFMGRAFPDALRAATFDVQAEEHILQVGGLATVPVGEEGQTQIGRYLLKQKLNTIQVAQAIGDSEGLTEEQKDQYKKVQYDYVVTNADSLNIQAVQEYDANENIWRKRLYVASGTGGVAKLNLDDQNSLQLINEIQPYVNHLTVTDVEVSGHLLAASRTLVSPGGKGDCSARSHVESYGSLLMASYIDNYDPVEMAPLDIQAGLSVYSHNGWLYSGGLGGGHAYLIGEGCLQWRESVAMPAPDQTKGNTEFTLQAVNLLEPVLSRSFTLPANIRDVVQYKEHLFVALGSEGVAIVDLNSEQGHQIKFDKNLMANAASIEKIKIVGHTLFLAGKSGSLVVMDVNNINQPKIISAGNTEYTN
ncbi:MAG: IPT/TIG domain-containing protein, partial [Colwellia sp.]